jgi:hypothetical protein
MRALNEVRGAIALQQEQYTETIGFLNQADDRSPYVLYLKARASAAAGQNDQAAMLFRKVADWNVNDLGYAMVRTEALEKAAAAPVATAGRKK